MTDLLPPPMVLAQAQQQPNFLLGLLPFALILLIFYFLILAPMRKKQKKVQEFQASLKTGDKIITTGGIYGQVVKVLEGTVQLQIADKVKIEVARAAIGGYQGQEPVVPQDSAGSV